MDRDGFISGVEKYFKDDLDIESNDELKRDFLRAYEYLEEYGLAEDFDLSFIPVLANLYMDGIRGAQNCALKNAMHIERSRDEARREGVVVVGG